MDEYTSVQKVWRAGTETHVITVNSKAKKLLNIDYGDLVEVTIRKLELDEQKRRFLFNRKEEMKQNG